MRFAPYAGRQIELIPLGEQHFAAARAGQQQEAQHVGGLLIAIFRQRLGQPRKLVRPQIAPALVFAIARDALGRIVRPQAPFDRQRKHRGGHRQHAIALYR